MIILPSKLKMLHPVNAAYWLKGFKFPTLALSRSGVRVEASVGTSSQPDSSSSPANYSLV